MVLYQTGDVAAAPISASATSAGGVSVPNFKIQPNPRENLGREGSTLMEAFIETIHRSPDAMRSNRTAGMALILLTETLGYTYASAYRLIRPKSRAHDASATEYVRQIKKHYREKYPLSISEGLEVNGITIEAIIADIKEEMKATKFAWNNDTGEWVPTNVPDYPTRRHAREQILKIVQMEDEARNELAIGKHGMQKMQLNTGKKFDSIHEWNEWMKGQHENTITERAQAAKDMKLIAAGRRIIQEEGQEAADAMRQRALDAGMTGDEPDKES